MTVLHGSWVLASASAPAAFAVWGERAPGRPGARAPRKAKQLPHRPPPHPFALSDDGIRHALSTLGVAQWASHANVRSAVAYLPSVDQAPCRSDEPVADPSACRLVHWDVPTVALDAAWTVVFLPRLAAAAASNQAVLGHDLRAWLVAARFALSLLARQRLLPGLQAADGRLVARWYPVVDEPADRANLQAVQSSMPPATAALSWTRDVKRASPGDLLADYFASVVDGVARQVSPPPRTAIRAMSAPAVAWLAAMSRSDPVVATAGDANGTLLREVSAWSQAPSYGEDGASFRLCFRLTPPETGPSDDGPAPWRLEYLLQAADDPSLLVPVDEVWRQRGDAARFLSRRFDQPHERVLAGLGRASRLFAALEPSLRTARPESCALTSAQAAELVRDKALLLKASGFGVLLPGLETRLGVRLRLRGASQPAPGAHGPSVLGLDSVVAYDWQLALGNQPLSRDEFELLARLKEPLVQLRGRWVDVRPEQIERALAFIRKHQDGTMPVGEALATALAPEALDGLPVTAVEATGWIDELLDELRAGGPAEAPAAPSGLAGELRPYQRRGVAWLATLRRYGLGALLADDMGLGKTVQVIGLILSGGGTADSPPPPSLVVCPTSVVGNWQREFARFAPALRVHVHHGVERAGADDMATVTAGYDVVLTTYALLHRDQAALASVQWDGLVLDEAQNVKNPATRAAQVARRLPARWRVALTGTPVENRLADLWSIFEVIQPGYLGSADQFKRQFALPIERASDADAAARLKKLTAPFILRRLKTDRSIIADLPDKQEMKVYCSLTREQATLYEAVVQDTMRQISSSDGIQRRGLVLALMTKLKQVCDHPALLLHDASALPGRSGKLDRLGEMLEEVIAVDERALVFTQYAEMGRLLGQHLAGALNRDVLFLHGGTPMVERDRLVARFQHESAGPPVLVLSLKAGGTGLNLTRANHVFHFDRWWNPAVENQATDRAFRIGQTRAVQVHKFLCAGTFEEKLDDLIERKVHLAEAIVGQGEAWITEMSTTELQELFSLRRQSVAA